MTLTSLVCDGCIDNLSSLFENFLNDPKAGGVKALRSLISFRSGGGPGSGCWNNLTVLTLTHNSIPSIDENATNIFKHFSSLTVLNLGSNKISFVGDFSPMQNLNYLDLSNNSISV